MSDFNIGEVITIEAQLKKYTPFGDHALTDADALPKITIKDNLNTEKVTSTDMVKSDTGKYYYICVTTSAWLVGSYQITIVSIYSSNTNTYIKNEAFYLKE